MKLRNIFIALALAAVPAVAQAQLATETATLNTTGTIASTVSASSSGIPMDFLTLTTGNNSATGEFIVSSNQEVTLSVTFSDLANGATTLPVTGACKIGTDPLTATAFASGCAAEAFTFIGTRSVYATGTVAIADVTVLPAGVYSGTATFNATYTSY